MKIPRTESLILFAFMFCVALWAISKCSQQRSALVRHVRELDTDDAIEDRPVRHDTVPPAPTTPAPAPVQQPVNTTIPAPTQYSTTLRQPDAKPERPTAATTTAPKPTAAAPAASPNKAKTPPTPSGSTLYVTIDGLKVRKDPGLKGETIEQLELYAPVTFLNQKTEWTQEISLGYEKVTDHWVKIRTASGKVGWVFGAGVHFYKMKREGVISDGKPAATAPKKKN